MGACERLAKFSRERHRRFLSDFKAILQLKHGPRLYGAKPLAASTGGNHLDDGSTGNHLLGASAIPIKHRPECRSSWPEEKPPALLMRSETKRLQWLTLITTSHGSELRFSW